MVFTALFSGKRSAAGAAGGPLGGVAGIDALLSPTERAFREAERHSARVRMLRKAIPLGCAVVVALVVVARFLNPFRVVEADFAVATTALQGSKLTMEQPKVAGFKKDNKAYEVVADSAVQDLKKPSVVELNKPVARIEMQKGTWARMSAQRGVYDSTTDQLNVSDDVNFKTDTGMEMKLRSAQIELKKGTLTTKDPVDVTLPNGWVKADRLTILDSGKSAVFEGNVKSEFVDSDAAPAEQALPPS